MSLERDRQFIEEGLRGGARQVPRAAPRVPPVYDAGPAVERRLQDLSLRLFGVPNTITGLPAHTGVPLVAEFATRIEQLERRLGPPRSGPPGRPIPPPGAPRGPF